MGGGTLAGNAVPAPRLRRWRRVLSLVVTLGCLLAGTTAQERPLPDLQVFLAQARTRLQTDNERQRSYIYVETQRRMKLDESGRARSESVKVVESYPALPGEDERWERVLEEDGRRKTEAELARQDAERRKTAEAVAKRVTSEDPADRAKAVRDYERDRREALARINDIFLVYDIRMLGRERVDGHDTIVLTLDPKPKARAVTREGKWMQYFKIRAFDQRKRLRAGEAAGGSHPQRQRRLRHAGADEHRHHHVVHAAVDQQRGVAAGAGRVHDPRPRAHAQALSRGRDDRLFELPEVHRRHGNDDRAAGTMTAACDQREPG